MIARLRDDSRLQEQLARCRGWKPETLRQLALEGYLGWDDQKHAIAFIYDTGVELRWREKGERVIKWLFGKPWLWRGSFLSIPCRQRVFICEGETDCVALLDCGLENDPAKLVVATPSASTFSENWTPLFADKDVILCFDGDDAGNAASIRIAKILRPDARSVLALDWEGLRRAC